MTRPRKTNKHLPQRVYDKNGAYRLLTKEGKWIRLGKTLPEMYQALSQHYQEPEKIVTIGKLIDRYMLEIAPLKAAKTYKGNIAQSIPLKKIFGDMFIEDLTAVDVYRYLDKRGKSSKTGANREFALLSHIFSYAIRWGLVKINPCTGVKKFSEAGRDRNVSDEDYKNFIACVEYPVKHLAQLAYKMLLRPTEALGLKRSNMLPEGFYVEITKTKKKNKAKIVEWDNELKEIIEDIKTVNKNLKIQNSQYLICNRKGEPYTADGFASLWQRAMAKAVKKGAVTERFQLRDLRHKGATDLEKSLGLEVTRKALSHSTQATSLRYIDGVPVVKGVQKT